jgi:hypothetical protein
MDELAILERQNKEKEQEKNELLTALAVLAKRTSKDWSLVSYEPPYRGETVRYTYSQIIKFAISDNADSSVARIADLHRRGLLKKYVEEFKGGELAQKEISPTLVANLLEAATPKSNVAPSSASANILPYRLSSYSPALFRNNNKSNSNAATVVAVAGGASALLLGGGLAAMFTLLTKSAMVSTAVMATAAAAATTTTAFPPALIGVIAMVVTVALILATIAIVMAIKHYHNQQTRALVNEALRSKH